MPVRAASGVVMIIIAVAAIGYGSIAFTGLLSAAAVAIAVEWAGLMGAGRVATRLLVAATALPLILLILLGSDVPREAILAAAVAAALAVALLSRSVWNGAGVLYALLPILSLIYLRDQYDGITLTLWTLVIVWATDIGAYFAGRAIGGPKLAPRLSPNKTWAGLIGGMVAALVIGVALAFPFNISFRLAGTAALLAAAAQGGDLFESWLKRRAGVKDSGHLLPGHGGVMDRVDGVVPVAVIVAGLVMVGYP
nr:phosphatidate cytidylyltransferase [Sphingomonas quercus]